MQILRCFENTPHPITPSPLPSPQGRGKRGEGSWGEGLRRAFSRFQGAARGMSDCYENGSPEDPLTRPATAVAPGFSPACRPEGRRYARRRGPPSPPRGRGLVVHFNAPRRAKGGSADLFFRSAALSNAQGIAADLEKQVRATLLLRRTAEMLRRVHPGRSEWAQDDRSGNRLGRLNHDAEIHDNAGRLALR